MRDQIHGVADASTSWIEQAKIYIEAIVGGVLFSFQFWHTLIEQISYVAHIVTEWGAAVITIHGLWRVYRHHRPKRPKTQSD